MNTRVALVFAFAAAAGGCDGRSSITVTQPDPRVLTTLKLPWDSVLLTQEESMQLNPAGFDQFGKLMTSGAFSYMSDAPQVVRVSSSGYLEALSAGTARVSASLTIASITQSAVVTIRVVPWIRSDVVVLIPGTPGWTPAVAHLNAGGIVEWHGGVLSWGGVPIDKVWLFDAGYQTLDSIQMINGVARRQFTEPGIVRYCSGACWDPPDYGIIDIR